MFDDEPHLFFMHFWANDDAQKRGLAAALGYVAAAKCLAMASGGR